MNIVLVKLLQTWFCCITEKICFCTVWWKKVYGKRRQHLSWKWVLKWN